MKDHIVGRLTSGMVDTNSCHRQECLDRLLAPESLTVCQTFINFGHESFKV